MVAVNPPSLGPPVGFSHGIVAGKLLFVAGQVGARHEEGALRVVEGGFAAQFDAALGNVLEVVRTAGAQPQGIVEMTVFVTDMDAYRAARKQLGEVWRKRMGAHYPAMTLVQVAGLYEPGCLVEIRAVASLER